MFRLAPGSAKLAVFSICIVVLTLLAASAISASTGPRNVLVVMNTQSSTSRNIANYYMTARGIPYGNLCQITCSTSENVSRTECETNILAPVRAFLQNPAMSDHIDYIVLTKGIPLSANYGYSSGPLSITSIMACLDDPTITEYIENPYGPISWDPVEVAFSHKLDLCGLHMYLVTRLDGYCLDDIHNMIDRALTPSPLGPVLLDLRYLGTNPSGPDKMLNDRLMSANTLLTGKGIPTIYDNTSLFVGYQFGLMGYFSWGSNDGSFTQALYNSNTFVPGSVADSFVSSSARTFNYTTGGQSLIADLITQGACAVCGPVSEPYDAYATYPDILFDRYTKGYNMAESFYAAMPMLFWKFTVVGDPLMAPYATAPVVRLQFPALPLTGTTAISATATDPEGISQIDFYFDGSLIGSCTSPPYSVDLDTTAYSVGNHIVEAKATDAGPVSTEGSASITVSVTNPVSTLRKISEAFPSPDGQLVRTMPKVVTAGTVEMGGQEFYIGEPNRACGIKVSTSAFVNEGDVVTVSGMMVGESDERCIEADDIQIVGSNNVPSPLGIPNRIVGGMAVSPYTKGVTGGSGLRNTGLLIKTSGRTTYIGNADEGFFYVDDGSGLKDGSGHVGLKVNCRDLIKPALNVYVLITGISSCEAAGASIVPVVKIRRQSDVVVVTP